MGARLLLLHLQNFPIFSNQALTGRDLLGCVATKVRWNHYLVINPEEQEEEVGWAHGHCPACVPAVERLPLIGQYKDWTKAPI